MPLSRIVEVHWVRSLDTDACTIFRMSERSQHRNWDLNLAKLAGVSSLALGAIVLMGWYLHEPALIQVNPAFVPMQYNTALGFALSGIALLSIAWRWSSIARITGVVVLLIGVLTLCEYLFGVDLHIDQLFMEHYIDVKTSNPGRMAPNTALCFSLTGLTVLLTSWFRDRARVTSWTATLGALIISLGVTALAGYMVGLEDAYGWGHMTRMAIHTAAGIIILGVGFVALAWSKTRLLSRSEFLPRWLPQVIGITGLTITFALWQALSAQEQRMVREFGSDAANLSDEALLAFGILLTFTLAFNARAVAKAGKPGSRIGGVFAPYVVIVLGALLAISLFSLLETNFEASVKQRFEAASRIHIEAIEHGVQTYLETLYHVRSAFDASTFVGRDEFRTLVSRNLERNPGILALAWVPKVSSFERDALEVTIQEQVLPNFSFSDQAIESEATAASPRLTHFPILYLEPLEPYLSIVGFDMAAKPEYALILSEAARTDMPFASSSVHLVNSEEGAYSTLAALPVYEKGVPLSTPESREAALRGFAVMITEIGPMIEAILDRYISAAGLTLTIKDIDESAPEAYRYRHVSRQLALGKNNREKDYLDDGLTATRSVTFANLGWKVTSHAANKEIYPSWDANNLWLPLGVIMLALGLAYFLYRLKQAEGEIKASMERVEAANQAKSAFLANMSHELRTPMNAILGYSEMLIEEAEDLDQEDFIPDLKKINQAGTHLLALINDVLDLSKIESGKMEAFPESIDLGKLIDEVVSTAHPLMEKNDNKLSVERGEKLGSAFQDLTKVRQILFNLLSNAAKFTHQGNVTLRVDRTVQAGVERLTFAVSDTGIGIAEDKIDHVFEEFTQADGTTTRDYGGTGLGLAISRRFCELLGGDLRVYSRVGEGSTFTINIPAILPGATPQDASTDSTSTVKTTQPTIASDTVSGSAILVIDDDPEACEIIERYLMKDGYDVVTAASGEEGLRLAHEIQPAAITLDVMMPDMDGWSVLRALKADPDLRDTPVIMLSMIDDRTRGYSLGAVDYLTKPVDREQLHNALSRYHCAEEICTVLLVDDDPKARELMAPALKKAGWAVTEAGNGQEALEVMVSEQPRLILLDLMMPVMDGFSFLAAMRANPDWQQIPVIVITAKDLTADDRDRLNGLVEDVLEKNAYTREQLLERVRAAVAACNIS